jgi:hypothetical protein
MNKRMVLYKASSCSVVTHKHFLMFSVPVAARCKMRKRSRLGAVRISLYGHCPHPSNQEGGRSISHLEWRVAYGETLYRCNRPQESVAVN